MNLFSGSLSQVIVNQQQLVRNEILNIKEIPENIEECKKSLYEKYVINPIVFDENIERKDVKQYEVSQNIMATFGTITKKEQKISIKYHILFAGDKDLLFLGGNTVQYNWHLSIQNYKVEKNYIEIEHNWISPNKDINNQQKEIDLQNRQFLEYLKTNTGYQTGNIDYFNNELHNLIEHTLNQRIVELKKANEVFLAFGGKIEERKPENIKQKDTVHQYTNVVQNAEVKKINQEPLHKEISSRGGKNSYQKYKPLKAKVEELCKIELQKNKNISVLQLCNLIGNIIENKYSELLDDFTPYQNYLKAQGTDWLKPTIYNWCLSVYKNTTQAK